MQPTLLQGRITASNSNTSRQIVIPGVALPTRPFASGESKPTRASESYKLTRQPGEWNLLCNNYH